MKYLTTVLSAAVLAAAGCATPTDLDTAPVRDAAPERVTYDEPDPEPVRDDESSYSVSERAFVKVVRDNYDDLADESFEDVLALGHTACDLMDAVNASSAEEYAAYVLAHDTEGLANVIAGVSGAASTTLCPRWRHLGTG